MSRLTFSFFLPLISTLFFCLLPINCLANVDKTAVLILHSYHVGYKWADEVNQGIMDALKPIMPQLEIHLEHMDTKRHYSPARLETLREGLALKYKHMPLDYVISSDDNAFRFLQQHRLELFPGARIIFCGTNYLQSKDLEGHDSFYGITEEADIESTINLMLKIHPRAENIYIINDKTVTGNIVNEFVNEAVTKFQEKIRFTYLDNLSMRELQEEVANLPPGSLLLYILFLRDGKGKSWEYDESIQKIADVANVPIYGVWDFFLGHGLVGGMLTSGYQQGKAAGELTKQMIEENHTGKYPRLSQSPNRYMFDYNMLKKHDISLDLLPEDSIVLDRPYSFFQRHKKVLLYSACAILLLTIIIFILAFNIIRRKRAEKELHQSVRNFKGIFDNATEGLFQSSISGRFLKVNDSLAKILGCNSTKEVIDIYKNLRYDLYAVPERRDRVISQVLNSGKTQTEVELYRKDRSKIIALLCCHNVTDEKGRHLYLEGSITDMTEYKRTQEIIIQTEKMISLGGLSAGIAHEIKNPLTSMIQASHVISNRLEKENEPNIRSAETAGITMDSIRTYLNDREVPQLLSNIIDSGNRAHVIVEDMLSFSKKTIGEFSNEHIKEIVEEAVELAKKDYTLKRDYNFNTINLNYVFPEQVPLLHCSRTKLRQVFFNLFKNSAEAMAEAKTKDPQIICSLKHDNESLTLRIVDNGPGINQRDREKIFEPFFTTKGGKKGTGLGLSIAYFIITENHKGKMSVNTATGRGAEFILQFPLGEEWSSDDVPENNTQCEGDAKQRVH